MKRIRTSYLITTALRESMPFVELRDAKIYEIIKRWGGSPTVQYLHYNMDLVATSGTAEK